MNRTPVTRTGGPAITPSWAALAESWPEVSRRLAGVLRARGLDGPTVDDVIQETAARALARRVQFESADDLFAWAVVTARNYATDLHRRQSFMTAEPVPDRPIATDVETHVQHRLELRAVRKAFHALRPNDQQALRTPVAAASGPERNRAAVRRHRARVRLLALMERLAGVIAWVFGRRLRPRTVVTALAVPTALFVGALTLEHLSPATPDGGGAVSSGTTVVARTTGARPDAANPAGEASAPARSPSLAPIGGRPPLRVQVPVPGPDGRPSTTYVRPKAPDDHLACLDTIAAGWRCVDLPVSLTH